MNDKEQHPAEEEKNKKENSDGIEEKEQPMEGLPAEEPELREEQKPEDDRKPEPQPPQNPYNGQPYSGPYGGYQNPGGEQQYPGGYQDPGQRQNPNRGYDHRDNPYEQQQERRPYWDSQYSGQYAPYGGGQPPMPPKKMNTGLKIFLWVLGVVAGSIFISMIFFAMQQAQAPQRTPSSAASSQSGEAPSSRPYSSEPIIGAVPGNGTNPSSTGIQIQKKPSGSPIAATQVYKNVIQSVVGVQTTIKGETAAQSGTSEGTGIIATPDGYILTNAHVVNNSGKYPVKVILHNNKQFEAKVVGYDKTTDLAVLKINATNLSPATFGSSDDMQVGDSVIAIGNPGGLSFAGSLTGGLISALDRTIENHSDNGMTFIQTDAAINPGNSGGPLVNMFGQVIGINSNKIITAGYEGMGFAIPISRAKNIIDDLIAHGYVSGRSRLGITGRTVSDLLVQMYGLPRGVLIEEISSDSDLRRFNVVKGDIITKVDGKAITGMDELVDTILGNHKPGDIISMTIYTDDGYGEGKSRDIRVRLLEDKGETQKAD